MRKTKKQSVMLACAWHHVHLLGTFCVEEEVYLLYMEGSLVLLPADDMATVVDIHSHVTVSGNCCNWERCFIADNRNYCREMLVGGAARTCEYVIFAPLQQ